MKITPKRPQYNSTESVLQAHRNAAQGPIEPPEHVTLRDSDKPFWDAIVTARPRDTWTNADLAIAANLARTLADIETVQAGIDQAGLIVDDKVNPACELLDKMTRRSLAMSRQLMVATIATVGRAQDIHKAAKQEREVRADLSDDDLIPMVVQ